MCACSFFRCIACPFFRCIVSWGLTLASAKRRNYYEKDDITAAAKIIAPPTSSFVASFSPNSKSPLIAVKTGSELMMTLASVADTCCCPFCCNTSAMAPGPTALNANQNQAEGLVHQGGPEKVADFQRESSNHQLVYMTARKSVLIACRGNAGKSILCLLLSAEDALESLSK